MNIMKTKTLIISLVAVLVVVGVYVSLRGQQPSTTNAGSAASSLAVGKPAPDFSAETIDGQQFSLAAHKGKPVIIFAMFGGCGECIPVGQTLNKIQTDYAARGVSVIAIDILKGEPISTLQQYRDYVKASFPFVSYDENIVRAYQLTAPEITYVIDKNSNVADINQGGLSYEQYKQQIEQAL